MGHRALLDVNCTLRAACVDSSMGHRALRDGLGSTSRALSNSQKFFMGSFQIQTGGKEPIGHLLPFGHFFLAERVTNHNSDLHRRDACIAPTKGWALQPFS